MAPKKKKSAAASDSSGVSPSASPPPPGTGQHQKKLLAATVAFGTVKKQVGCNDVFVEKLDISYHGKEICNNATLMLYHGHRYGLVGANGVGKTTLMDVLGSGEIPFPERVDYYYVTSEVEACEATPLEMVMRADQEKVRLETELEELALLGDDDNVASRLEEIYARLDELDADTAEARAGRILFGLGFDAKMQQRPCSSFSGGWRMRVSLAQALFINPTLLLLDEPTNHLDIEAVVWLEGYLAKFKKILFMSPTPKIS